MARSDLIVNLVKASARGDKNLAQKTVEAIIAEERAKQHHAYADKLDTALKSAQFLQTGNAYSIGREHSKVREYIYELDARYSFSDLILSKPTSEATYEFIEEQRRADLLRSHSIEPRHTILLAGPPGNGKTSYAEAIAESLGIPFFTIRYEAVIGSYLGETAERLRQIFDYIKTTPCVLFFDEFDAIGKERGDLHETGEIKRVVTSLLMQVDRVPSYTIVIAATNHPELLDRAVWRRFELKLEMPSPTQAEAEEYIRRFQDLRGISFDYGNKLIAKRLGNISYSEIENFLKDVHRTYILSMGAERLKEIVARTLNNWEKRYSHSHVKDVDQNGPANSKTRRAKARRKS